MVSGVQQQTDKTPWQLRFEGLVAKVAASGPSSEFAMDELFGLLEPYANNMGPLRDAGYVQPALSEMTDELRQKVYEGNGYAANNLGRAIGANLGVTAKYSSVMDGVRETTAERQQKLFTLAQKVHSNNLVSPDAPIEDRNHSHNLKEERLRVKAAQPALANSNMIASLLRDKKVRTAPIRVKEKPIEELASSITEAPTRIKEKERAVPIAKKESTIVKAAPIATAPIIEAEPEADKVVSDEELERRLAAILDKDHVPAARIDLSLLSDKEQKALAVEEMAALKALYETPERLLEKEAVLSEVAAPVLVDRPKRTRKLWDKPGTVPLIMQDKHRRTWGKKQRDPEALTLRDPLIKMDVEPEEEPIPTWLDTERSHAEASADAARSIAYNIPEETLAEAEEDLPDTVEDRTDGDWSNFDEQEEEQEQEEAQATSRVQRNRRWVDAVHQYQRPDLEAALPDYQIFS